MKTFSKHIITFVVIASIELSCAPQSSPTSGESPRDSVNQVLSDTASVEQAKLDSEFVLEAADDGMLEAQLGELALQKALSPEVKSFARTMVSDHGKANVD